MSDQQEAAVLDSDSLLADISWLKMECVRLAEDGRTVDWGLHGFAGGPVELALTHEFGPSEGGWFIGRIVRTKPKQ